MIGNSYGQGIFDSIHKSYEKTLVMSERKIQNIELVDLPGPFQLEQRLLTFSLAELNIERKI